jgi:hypothetical protein
MAQQGGARLDLGMALALPLGERQRVLQLAADEAFRKG